MVVNTYSLNAIPTWRGIIKQLKLFRCLFSNTWYFKSDAGVLVYQNGIERDLGP
jgi:hypothetical protein